MCTFYFYLSKYMYPSYKETSLASICVDVSLNTFLESCDSETLNQLQEMTYENRIMFFENITYHPIAVMLASRYTMLNDYPIFGELYPFDMPTLQITIKEKLGYSNVIRILDIIKSRDNKLILDLIFDMVPESHENVEGYVVYILVWLSHLILELEYKNKYNVNMYRKLILLTKQKLLNKHLDNLPLFKSRIFNVLYNFESTIETYEDFRE